MTRDEVIKALECCVLRDPDDRPRCGDCPYPSGSACANRLKMDALALLKQASMSELDKLEQYLQEHGYKYTREDVDGEWGRHQIVVYDAKGARKWDAICHRGSYGYEDGLLEIYVDYDKDGDSVVGWLTAEDVIKRVRESDDKR